MTIQSLIDLNGKKFDVCLMNPPYDKNLHLKFLEKVIGTAEKTVSIQPSSWVLRDVKQDIIEKIYDLEVIPGEEFRKIFNIQCRQGGIFVMTNEGGFDVSKLRISFPAKKIKENAQYTFKDVNEKQYDEKGIFVPLKLMTAEWDQNKDYIVDKIGILIDGKTLDGIYYKDVRRKNKDRPCGGIHFDTLKEAENFVKYTQTEFFVKYVNYVHLTSRYLLKDYPFMLDYTREWSDNDLYKYFKLTKEEIKQIEDYNIR